MKDKNNLYAVILAGGSGTRFWPLSRKSQPKQFLKIVGSSTLFVQTIERIRPLIQPSHIFIVTNKEHCHWVKTSVRRFSIPVKNILLEEVGKNTAPAICWAASRIFALNPQGILAILPSDHVIRHKSNFLKVLQRAFTLSSLNYLVTLGIVPHRPETGYGYLKFRKIMKGKRGVFYVEKFTEKPNIQKAKIFVKSKKYLWNSGMFIWKASVILNEFKRYLPRIYHLIYGRNGRSIQHSWRKLPSISIDYGILEKSKSVVTVPSSNIGWSDLGSWEALREHSFKDRQGNVIKGKGIHLFSQNNLIWADKRLIATIGLKDCVVIDTPDSLLICRKDLSQYIRQVVATLSQKKPSVI